MFNRKLLSLFAVSLAAALTAGCGGAQVADDGQTSEEGAGDEEAADAADDKGEAMPEVPVAKISGELVEPKVWNSEAQVALTVRPRLVTLNC